MDIPNFIGGSYTGYSTVVNAQRCVNFFPVLDKTGGKPLTLQGTPGLKTFVRFGETDQDLTTYTETDANSRFSITASVLTFTGVQLQDTNHHVYDDFTADYFDQNFVHQFDFNVAQYPAEDAIFYPWVMSNRPGEDMTTHNNNARDYLALRGLVTTTSGIRCEISLYERKGSSVQNTATIALECGTEYYISITRDESAGASGILRLDVYTDSDRTILFGTKTLTLTDKEDFRYLYWANVIGGGGTTEAISGTVSNPTDATAFAEVRGMSRPVDVSGSDVIYAAIGDDVVKLETDGSMTDKGTLSTSTGPVYFADNGSKIILVDGDKGWSIVSDTVAEITDGDFPSDPTGCTYQDGYFMVNEDGTDNWYISDTDDPTSWPGDYASAEGHGDNISRLMSDGRHVWLFGFKTFQVWYNSGDATFPFDRVEGATKKIGLGAEASLAEDEGTFFWFTDNRRVAMSHGFDAIFISTPQIEYNYGNYATVSDAVGMARTQEGHQLYTITFPTENATWEYNATTGFWHELESIENERWRSNCYTYFNDKHYTGDFELSNIYEIDTDTYTDNGQVVKRIRTSNEIWAGGNTIFFGGLEVIGETGVANENTPGDDPQMTLEWSNDGGRTWETSVSVDWGTYQNYTARTVFRRLGRARRRLFRISIEDQVKSVITGVRYNTEPIIGIM